MEGHERCEAEAPGLKKLRKPKPIELDGGKGKSCDSDNDKGKSCDNDEGKGKSCDNDDVDR